MVFTSLNIFALTGNYCLFNARNKSLVANLYKNGIGIINFGKLFVNFIKDALN